MGEVYRARDTKLGREVAVKVLPTEVVARADARARFEREARAVAALSHPNILAIHDFGESDGMAYAVMELLEGETLRDALAHGALPSRRAIAYAIQIANGLAAAHEKGIVHRDLKPENVFVTPDERVKILDFGLARQEAAVPGSAHTVAETIHRPTDPGMILGTVGYMSPEQVRGLPVDGRADLFSFGATLYEMVTGQRAFNRATPADTMTAILREDPPDPPFDRPLPPAIDRIIRHCLEKKPEARFRSAHDLAFALDAIATPSSASGSAVTKVGVGKPARSRRALAVAAAVAAIVAASALGIVIGRRTAGPAAVDQPERVPTFQKLTFRRGIIPAARFAPDGQNVVYSAAWDGGEQRLFLTRLESLGATPIGVADARLLSISPTAELALGLQAGARTFPNASTLAQTPLLGGAPRSVLEGVTFADWSPTGSGLAVVRAVGSRERLEFPAGRILYETEGQIGFPRVSPAGDRIAFLDWPVKNDDRGTVATIDLNGVKKAISRTWEAVSGLAWSPDGREVWYTATMVGTRYSLMGSTLDGRERPIYVAPGGLLIEDIAKDGRVLLATADRDVQINVWPAGEAGERTVTGLDYALVRDISPDGQRLLMSYSGEGSGASYDVYVGTIRGGDATRLGEGQAQQFSPDGRSVLSVVHGPPSRVMALPIGPGDPRIIPTATVTVTNARWLPDGRRLLAIGTEPGKRLRAYVIDLGGAAPRPISPEGITFAAEALALSPDGTRVVLRSPDARVMLYRVDGGEPIAVNGLQADEMPTAWSGDSRSLLLREGDPPRRIVALDPVSGRREPVKAIRPSDPSLFGPTQIVLTPDARSYAANYGRSQMTLFLVDGLK